MTGWIRWTTALMLTCGLLAACGDKGTGPTSNSNKNNNNDRPNNIGDDDFGSIFPDVSIDNSQNVNPSDMGIDVENDVPPPADLGRDLGQDVGEDMAPNCPRVDVALGEPCGCNQECTSGVCADAAVDADGFCTMTCTTRADCPGGQTCVTDRFGSAVCRVDDTGANCTQAQQAAPSLCSAGHCLQAGSNFPLDFFCSVPCDQSTDCMLGHSCTPVRCQFSVTAGYRCLPTVIASRSPNKAQVLATFPESTKLCIAVGAPNPCGAMTMSSDEQACPGSMCDADPVTRCTAGCSNTNDCPSGGCVDYDVSDGNLPIRICDL